MNRPVCVASIALLLASAGAANAETRGKAAVDVDAAIALSPTRVSSLLGGALRLGVEFDAKLVSLTPEVGASYHGFSGDLAPGALRGFGGARLAVGAVVRPGIYFHGGYAQVTYDRATPGAPPSRSGPTWDGGLSLDLTVLPVIDLGLHVGYTVVTASRDDAGDALRWLAAGAHLAVVF